MSDNLDTNKQIERYLIFNMGAEAYALPLSKVKEVIGLGDITPIPSSPNYFKGIMNLRGIIVSIVDLRLKLKIPEVPNSEKAIIVLDAGDLSLGIIVDFIDSVIAIETDAIQPSPIVNGTAKLDYVTGVIHGEKRLILALEIDKALSNSDQKLIQQNLNKKISA